MFKMLDIKTLNNTDLKERLSMAPVRIGAGMTAAVFGVAFFMSWMSAPALFPIAALAVTAAAATVTLYHFIEALELRAELNRRADNVMKMDTTARVVFQTDQYAGRKVYKEFRLRASAKDSPFKSGHPLAGLPVFTLDRTAMIFEDSDGHKRYEGQGSAIRMPVEMQRDLVARKIRG